MKKIIMEFHNNQKSFPLPKGLRTTIRKCCEGVLDEEGFNETAEVSVTIVDNAEIQQLNNEFRDIDRPTDVLSFPMGEDGEFDIDPETNAYMLGDIVISIERAAEQANEFGHSLEREVGFLATHSMLHLFGYDHVDDPEGEKVMIEKQEKVLNKLNITRDNP